MLQHLSAKYTVSAARQDASSTKPVTDNWNVSKKFGKYTYTMELHDTFYDVIVSF